MPRNYEPGRLVYVLIEGFSNLRYTFKTRVKQGTSTDLGHVALDANNVGDPQGFVIGANSPKPPRATIQTPNGIEGSYVDRDKIGAAKNMGYQISRGIARKGTNTQFTKCLYVTVNGIKYAWNSPTSNQEPGDLGVTGAQQANANDQLVFGANFPKPPRVKKKLQNGSTYSTYCEPTALDQALQAGWSGAGKGLYTEKDFEQFT